MWHEQLFYKDPSSQSAIIQVFCSVSEQLISDQFRDVVEVRLLILVKK